MRAGGRSLVLATLALVVLASASATSAQKAPCTLVPLLRDVTINQGVGAYTQLVNGKETLARLYLSKPSCAGSGASIQVTGGSLSVRNGGTTLGTIASPTPAPSSTAPPEIATFDAAAMADSTGDPKFVIPPSVVTQSSAYTATFVVTIAFRQKASRNASYANGTVTFTNRPGSNNPINASFAAPSNPLSVLFVPMGDATKSYSSQWTSTGQQNLQDGMTAAVARQYPLPAGTSDIGGTGGLRYTVTPTLLDLAGPGLLDPNGKFCGTGASYDRIKALLAQFRLSHNTANPGAQANRVVGIVDPAIGLGPPSPCFEGMSIVNSSEAWALALPGKTGQLVGLELAHTFGLTPPNRENPFDGAHSQNVAAENPSVNRRFNVVERAFVPTDRSLLKPSATSPLPSNTNTLLEVPDYSFLHCVFGGPTSSECQTYGPGTVSATAPVAATLSFVMSGTTTGEAGLCIMCVGTADGTAVVESYFASDVPQTSPSAASDYRLVQRDGSGSILSNQGVPVTSFQSGHGDAPDAGPRDAGLFAFALPFQTQAERIELWKGAPGGSGSFLLYAQNRTQTPQVTDMTVGDAPITLRQAPAATAAPIAPLATFTVTSTSDSGAGSLRQAIIDANAAAGADTITFAIPGAGPYTIQPSTQLPGITGPTVLDGTTQPGFSGTPIIELDGSLAGESDGLFVSATGPVMIRGLVVNRFGREGIQIAGTGAVTIQGNYIGTNVAGTEARPNGLRGVLFNSSSGHTVGGTAAGEGNVISGNSNAGILLSASSNVTILGNRIGTNAAGTAAVPNGPAGIQLYGGNAPFGANGNTIGGSAAGAGNLISGNTGPGILMNSSGASPEVQNNIVRGNLIGTDATGEGALPNSGANGDGISIVNVGGIDDNVIGGIGTGEPNTIAFNAGDGISIQSDPGNVRNQLHANRIHSNGGLGIDLGPDGVTENDAGDADSGANDLQNYPVVTSADPEGGSVRIQGTLASTASTTFTFDFYASEACDGSGSGEAERWIGWGQMTTNASGDATIDTGSGLTAPVSSGEWVTVTATDPSGNTSEFSSCVIVSGDGDSPQPGPTFVVNTNSDGTPTTVGCTTTECTLREAITAANAAEGANTIEFDVAGDTQIALDDALPSITDEVLIDGLSQPEGMIVINGDGAGAEVDGLGLAAGSGGSEIRGLEIRDFLSGAGIRIVSADNTIASNTIRAVNDGIVVSGSGATGNVIGADVAPNELSLIDDALGNVLVEAGGHGLEIVDGASGTVVAGNYVGTDRTGATTRGNGGTGIRVDASSGNQLGPGNTVTRNGSVTTGIRIESGFGNRIVANSIHDNFGKGISVFEGANGDLSRPTLTSAISSGASTTISGAVTAAAGSYFVELFRNPACDPDGLGFGEGETYLAFAMVTVTDGSEPFSTSVSGLAAGDVVTATLTSATTEDTSEFSNCETVEEAVGGQEPVAVTATDDNPADNTLDLFLDCGSGMPKQVIAVGLRPNDVDSTTASWSTSYDSTLAPPGCSLQAVVMDGFSRSGFSATGTETAPDGPNPVVAAVSSPRQGQEFLQYGVLPLRGSVRNAQGEFTGSDLEWSLTGPGGTTRSGSGPIVDLQPPDTNGWPAGSYTATLTKPGSMEPSATDTVTFTVVTDADNDGIPASVESQSCFGTGDNDNDPLNAFGDADADGVRNADDQQPCVPGAEHPALVGFNPDPLPAVSSGTPVTVEVRVPKRNLAQVAAGSVRITMFAGKDVSTDPRFASTAWTVDKKGVGIAKFGRQNLVEFLTQNDIRDQLVSMTIQGSAPTWSFEGSDTFTVQG